MKTESYPTKNSVTKLLSMLILLFLMGAGVSNQAQAAPQTYTIGGAGYYSTAIGPYICSATDQRVAFLYRADEVKAALGWYNGCPMTISEFGFNVYQLAYSLTYYGFTIKMQNTTNTNNASFTNTGWTTVYSSNVTLTSTGWQMYTLSTPFVWDGSSGILVDICWDNYLAYAVSPYNPVLGDNLSGWTPSCRAYSSANPVGGLCTTTTVNSTSTFRPQIRIVGDIADPQIATDLTLANILPSIVQYNATPWNWNNVVIAVRENDANFSSPSGTPPAAGQPFANGTLIYNGVAFPQNYNFTPNANGSAKNLYFRAWTYDGLNYSCQSTTKNITTLCAELAPPTFAVSLAEPLVAQLTGSLYNDQPIIIIRATSSGAFTTPSGPPPAVGSSFAGGTLVFNGTDLPFLNTGLSQSTTYYYRAYTWDGTFYSCDYKQVSVTTPCVPLPPSSITATVLSASSISVNASPSPQNNNIIVVWNNTGSFSSPSGTALPNVGASFAGGTVLYRGPASGFPLTHSGLLAGKTYYYRAWSYMPNAAPIQWGCLNVNANATLPCVLAPPYLEGFEAITSSNTLPPCASATRLGSYTYTAISSSSYNRKAYAGTDYGYFRYSCNDWFFFGPITLTGTNSYLGKVKYITDGYSGWTTFRIAYGTTADAGSMSTIAQVSNVTNTTYQELSGNFCPTASGNYYIGIYCQAGGVPWYLSFDNVEVVTNPSPPAYPAPTACATNLIPLDGTTGVILNPTLSWSAVTNATTYDLYIGTTTNPPYVASIGSTSVYVASYVQLQPNTLYYWKIVPKSCGGAVSGCTEQTFTTGTSGTYCTVTFSSAIDEDISRVMFGTMNNKSPNECTPVPNYTDYTYLPPQTIKKNFTYPIWVTKGDCENSSFYSFGVRIFVDWNHDFNFTSDELAYNSGYQYISADTMMVQGSITVPATSLLGNTRMRIILDESYSNTWGCGSSYYGETEDYTVNVEQISADLTVSSWVAPKSSCALTANEIVKVNVRNDGLVAQSNYTMSFFDGTTWKSELATGTINPGQTITYTFTNTGNFSTVGNYNVMAAVALPGDQVPANDTLKGVVIVNSPVITVTPSTPYLDNFDGATPWFTNSVNQANNSWQLGTPAKAHLNGAYSGTNAWVTKVSGNYNNSEVSWVESPCFNLSGLSNPVVQLAIKYQTELNYDGVNLEYSIDQGATWNIIGALGDPNYWYNANVTSQPAFKYGWGGTSASSYVQAWHFVPGIASKPSVKFRVYFSSNGTINNEGFAFDDFRIYQSTALFATCPNITVNGSNGLPLPLNIYGGVPPYSVTWSPALGLNCNPASCPSPCDPTTCVNPIAAPPVGTHTYTAVIHDASNPPATFTVNTTVTVRPELTLNLLPSATQICDTAITQLYALVTGGTPFPITGKYQYAWSPATGLSATNVYNPVSTTFSSITYSVTVTDYNGFIVTGSIPLTVVHGYPVVDVHPQEKTICINDSVLLVATGGTKYEWTAQATNPPAIIRTPNLPATWVIPGVVNANIGTKFTCVVDGSCGKASDYSTIYTNPRPNVTLAAFNPSGVCRDHAPITLTGGMPLGGTYSGPGVSAGVFTPSAAGVGVHTITYSYMNQFGCVSFATRTMTVYDLPVVTLTLNPTAVCIDAAPYALTGGLPLNGTYSGPGVSGGIFSPAVAGVGLHEITYSYTDNNGCTASAKANLRVWPLPVLTPAVLPSVCVNAPSFVLSGALPLGGTYTGPGVVSNVFYPAVAGVGTWTITYTYKDPATQCVNSTTMDITVKPLPDITSVPENVALCAGDNQDYTLELVGTPNWTITYTANGVPQPNLTATESPFTFNLAPSLTTNYVITSITDATGCTKTLNIQWTVTVNPLPLAYYVVFNDIWPPYGHVCAGGLQVGLSGSQIGVQYHLYLNNVATGDVHVGNGLPFWFLPHWMTEGYYTVKAIDVTKPEGTNCENWMTGNPYLNVDTLELTMSTEFDTICLGGTTIMKAHPVNGFISPGPYLYDWSPDPDITHDGFDSIVAHPSVSKWIVVEVHDITGCSAIDSMYITVLNPPTVQILGGQPTLTMCAGNPVTLNTTYTLGDGTSIVSYQWSPSIGLSATNVANPVANPVSSTTYFVTITDNNGCEGYASIVVFVTPSPSVTFTGGNTGYLCYGSTLTIPTVVNGMGGGFTYAWSPAAGLSATDIKDPVASPTVTTTYTVTVTSVLTGCPTVTTYTVEVHPEMTIDAGPSFSICNGTMANLTVNVTANGHGPFQYQWSANPSVIWDPPASQFSNTASVWPQANSATMFYVTVTDIHGCSSYDSVLVNTDSIPTAHAGQDATICEGQSWTLTGSGGPTYQWFIQQGPPVSPVSNNPSWVVSPATTTTYELRVNSICGVALSYVTVTVNPMTIVGINIPDNEFCQGDASVLVTGTPTDGNGEFNVVPGLTDNQNGTATFDPTTPGVYTIVYSYTNAYGCLYEASTTVTVHALPPVAFEPLAPVCISASPFPLTGGTPVGGTYSGPGVLTGGVFVAPLAGIGSHTITYSFIDGFGCSASATAVQVVNPIPALFAVSVENNGHYCANDADGVIIYLSGSEPFETGVKYHLVLNGTYTGYYQLGTGLPIQFNGVTPTGTYKIVAEYPTGCTREMTGSAVVVIDPLPVVYNVGGGGSYCDGGAGVGITLDNSNTGINYELYYEGSYVMTLPGVNGILTFPGQTLAGTYTVKAVNAITGCGEWMNGSATVTILPLPTPFTVAIDPNQTADTTCIGSLVTIRLLFREVSVNYYLWSDQLNDTIPGSKRVASQGITLWWTYNNLAAGSYRIWAYRPSTGCSGFMRNAVELSYYENLAVVTHPADAYIDDGGSTSFHAVISGSFPVYQWQESNDYGVTWVDLADGGYYSGVNTPDLYLSNVPYSMTHYQYRLKTDGPCNQVYTSAATLYIDPIVHAYLGTVTVCAVDEVLAPIYFTQADSILAISLTIIYDNTNFTFTGYTNVDPIINIGNLIVFSAPGSNKIGISYYGNPLDPGSVINTGYGTFHFLDLKFNAVNAGGTVHSLNFDLSTPGLCELTKPSSEVLTTVFHNGAVTVQSLPVIENIWATDPELCAGENLYLNVTASHAQGEGLSYAWTGPNGFTSTDEDPVLYGVDSAANGTYYLAVTTTETGCVTTGQVDVIVHPLPWRYTVILPNGNAACAGSGVEVALSGSQLGVVYYLVLNGNYNAPVEFAYGTGAPITFGPQPVTGTYTVYAKSIVGDCYRDMYGSVHVQINPIPLWFLVQGGGHYCADGDGKEIKLSGSQVGVHYVLYLNACCCAWDSIMDTVVGTGSPISFGLQKTPGYYSVVAYNFNTGCQNNMIGCIPIIIDPLPTVCISGAPSVCFGQCAELTLTMTGKAPFTVTIEKSTGGTFDVIAPTSPFNIEVCPDVTTTYTAIYVIDANGCDDTGSCQATVTIWDLPVVNASNSGPVCVGGTVNFTGTASGFGVLNYLWTGPNGFSSTEQNPVIPNVTLENAGTYILQVVDEHQCMNTDTTELVVNPLPVLEISGSSACVGGTLYLSVYASGNGPFTYSWTGPNGFVSTEQNPVITPADPSHAGIYTVVVTDVNGCVSTGTAELIVWDLPLVDASSNSPVCEGDEIHLMVTASGFGTLSYSWTKLGNGWSSNEQNPVIPNATLAMAGIYEVTVTDEHQCQNTDQVEVVVNPLPGMCEVMVTDPNVYCYGCIPPQIYLMCESDTNVSYELYLGGVATGVVVMGDGDSITFGHIATPGWYTVLATNVITGCDAWMYGEVQIIEQAPPTAVIYGDTICVGQPAYMKVDLTGDITGGSYWKLIISNGLTKDTVFTNTTPYYYTPGTGGHILAPTVTTTYTILLVFDRVCYNIGNAATVVVNPNPVKYTLTGGGYYCNGIGVNVGLNGSQIGINYILYRNGSVVVATVAGTGSAISFGPQPDGIYTVKAINPVTGCENSMNGEVIVLPDPGLEGFIASGGGEICIGSAGTCVYLNGSQLGKEYKLIRNGLYTGISVIGTGDPISFCGLTTAGTYTVLAFDPITTCTRNMEGSAVIVVHTLPTAVISGDATICYGESTTLHLVFTGTAPWYFVISDGTNSVQHLSPNATWDTIVTPPASCTYTITTISDAYCQGTPAGSAVIVVNSPTQFVVTGGGSYCAGGLGVVVGLSSSQIGVLYELYYEGLPTGNIVAGTGDPISFGYVTLAGTYTVVATNTVDNCSRIMNGTAVVVVNPLPEEYELSTPYGDSCCVTCNTVIICMDGSQFGVKYELFLDGVSTGFVKYGNGGEICFPFVILQGTYTVKATNLVTGCWRWFSDDVYITIYPQALVQLSGGGDICAGDSVMLTATLLQGTPPFSFGLSINGAAPVTFSNITVTPYTWYVKPSTTSNYTIAWSTDLHNCYNVNNPGVALVTVTPLPGVTLGEFNPVCANAPSFPLYGGDPPGGEYTGDGVVNGVFYPALANLGSNVITYTYTAPSGCQGFAYSTIIVNPLPDVSFTGLAPTYCVDGQPSLLVGNQAPYGYFYGNGIFDNGDGTAIFNPAVAGIGQHAITYTYTDQNGCSNSATLFTDVLAVPQVYFTGLNAIYCLNHPSSTLTGYPDGGTFSGPGIVGTEFNPMLAGVGEHTITYTYTSSNYCTGMYSQLVTVLPLPNSCEFTGGGVCCIGCSLPAILSCSDTGVLYQLVRNGNQNVGLPMVGTGGILVWTIYIAGNYTVIATNPVTGCTQEQNGVVNVSIIDQPAASLSGSTSICVGQCATITATLSGYPPFTIFFTDGTDTIAVNNIMDYTWDTIVCPLATTTYVIEHLQDIYCGGLPSNPVTITVNPAPEMFNVTGGGIVCQGGAGIEVGLDGSQAGLYYELLLNGNSTGIVVVGTGNALSFGYFSLSGIYTVKSVSTSTCEMLMNGYAEIIIMPLPTVTLEPFAPICENGTPFVLTGGYPDGGYYTVNGFTATEFDPSFVGPGYATIGYTYTDLNGCSNTATQNIYVYALPIVTLEPFAGICFNAAPITLSGGLPDGGTYYVNGLAATTFDPSAYGAGTYVISYEYTDGNGCTNMAEQTITVYSLPTVTLAQFGTVCQGGDPFELTGGFPAGGVYSGQFVTNGMFNPIQAGTYVITYTYTDGNGCTNSASQELTVELCALYAINGQVKYDNTAGTVMNNTTVRLMHNGSEIATTVTDGDGNYTFGSLVPGVYTVAASCSKPWGGVNSNDALLIMKHFAGITPLTGLRLAAADVDGSGFVNSVDALMVAKRFVNQIQSFPVGDWVFEVNTFTVTNVNYVNNFKALCFGDVNGSYTPPFVKVPATIKLKTMGVKEVQSYETFELPISVVGKLNVGAISLILNYAENLYEVEGVTINDVSISDLLYTAINGELRISWYSMKEMNLSDGNALVTLKLRVKDISSATAAELALTLNGSSELGDRFAVVIQNVNLTYPKITLAPMEYSISNYPNPFKAMTEITYSLPEDGVVSLRIYNVLGEEVAVLVNGVSQSASTYKVNFDGSALTQGVYTYKIEVKGLTTEFVKSGMMVLSR